RPRRPPDVGLGRRSRLVVAQPAGATAPRCIHLAHPPGASTWRIHLAPRCAGDCTGVRAACPWASRPARGTIGTSTDERGGTVPPGRSGGVGTGKGGQGVMDKTYGELSVEELLAEAGSELPERPLMRRRRGHSVSLVNVTNQSINNPQIAVGGGNIT